MGFSSNWIAFQGLTPKKVHRRMGLMPTGIWVDSPTRPFVGRQLPDGRYLIVEDSAHEEVSDTWDLAALSRGGGLWAVSEIDGAGYAYLSEWHRGKQRCEIFSDDGEWVQHGTLPAELDPEIQQSRAAADADDDVDATNLILGIAKQLTDYVCGEGLDEPLYELLAPVMPGRKRDNAANMIKVELTGAMVRAGYMPSEPLTGTVEGAFWFTRDAVGIPNTIAAVAALISYSRDGATICTGTAFLISPPVGDILRSMPPEALLRGDQPDNPRHKDVDWQFFSDMPGIESAGKAPWVITAADVQTAVQWFERRVAGAAATWFDDRNTLEKMIQVAEEPIPGTSHDRIDPGVLRATVLLCIVNGNFTDAATLMTAHLKRDHVQPNVDSFERVSAFDKALADRFPDYRRARGR